MRIFCGVLLTVWCILAAFSCQDHHAGSIFPADLLLKPGDVVFRRGEGITSRIVLAADRKGNYSHVGIVVDSYGKSMIVHVVPDDNNNNNDSDRVKMESPEDFYASIYATIGEVCRPTDSALAKNASEKAIQLYQRGVMFDHSYDMADTTKMYCTELVEYAYSCSGHSLAESRRHTVELPFLHASCIMPSDLYKSKFLRPVRKF